MLTGLIHLSACRAISALRARAAVIGWSELLGQAIDRAGDAVVMVSLSIAACVLCVLCAFALWPLSLAAMFGLVLAIGNELLQKARP
jgi:hypothetical protein